MGRLSQANPCVVKDLDGKVITGYKKQRFYKPKPLPPAVVRFNDERASHYKKAISPVELYDYDLCVVRPDPKSYSFSKRTKNCPIERRSLQTSDLAQLRSTHSGPFV